MSLLSFFRGRPRIGGTVLIAFASQSGTAEAIAWRSANALIGAGGFVRVVPLGGMNPDDLAEAGTLLVVASTTGAGDSPDSARGFQRHFMQAPGRLSGLSFGVLALGDRKYDATFCGFGCKVDRWLEASGARRLFDVVRMDSDDDAAMTKWCEHLGRLGARCDDQSLMPGPPQDWVLAKRDLLNPGSAGGQTYGVALTPADPAHLTWVTGDICEIWPRNPPEAVEDFLARHKLDGHAPFKWKRHWTPLSTILAMSRLPADNEMMNISLSWVVERLQWLGAREYSIASLPEDGRMDLLVRKAVRNDDSLGLGSGWLTQGCAIGGTVSLRVRPNPGFHPPADGGPQILIGAGTGMAGLRGHLRYRAAAGMKEAWLLFGERGQTDLYYADEIDTWRADGTLARTDVIFSREGAHPGYVQRLVEAAQEDIHAWVCAKNASILVCGGTAMAAGVHAALAAILDENMLDAMIRDGRYRRDIY